MVLFPEPSPWQTPLLESGNFQVIYLPHNPLLQAWEANENVFPVSLPLCALPCWSHLRENYCFTSWLKRVYNAGTFQLPKQSHYSSIETISIISVDLNWNNSAYYERRCQVHTQGSPAGNLLHRIQHCYLFYLERTRCIETTCSLCPVFWPAARSLREVLCF